MKYPTFIIYYSPFHFDIFLLLVLILPGKMYYLGISFHTLYRNIDWILAFLNLSFKSVTDIPEICFGPKSSLAIDF